MTTYFEDTNYSENTFKKRFLHTSAMDTNFLWKIVEQCYSAVLLSLLQFGLLHLLKFAKIPFITYFYLWGNGFDTIW